MTTQLSEQVKQLITKARIVSFATWTDSHPLELIQLCQNADDQGRYLTDADLEQIQTLLPDKEPLITIARLLRDRAPEIIAEARAEVLQQYPDINQPGGSLYPSARADACWRDFWHFLRCITYGIAGGSTEFTSSEGLHYMNLLYQELRVPLEAMVFGLEAIKSASLQRISQPYSQTVAPYFDQLINQLRTFNSEIPSDCATRSAGGDRPQ